MSPQISDDAHPAGPTAGGGVTSVPPAVARARDVPALLAALQASDPGRPRLTWYGEGGERIELSARVLATWVAKTAGLLEQECDVEPGDTVRLALPSHWRTTVLALATWSVGAEMSWDGDVDPFAEDDLEEPQEPTVLVTAAGGPVGPAGRVVAVDLPALSRAVPDLPTGALDYNAEVSGFDDVYAADEQVQDRALLDLARSLAGISGWGPGERVLGRAGDLGPDIVLGALLLDGSVVVVAPDAGVDLEQVAEQEQVTGRA